VPGHDRRAVLEVEHVPQPGHVVGERGQRELLSVAADAAGSWPEAAADALVLAATVAYQAGGPADRRAVLAAMEQTLVRAGEPHGGLGGCSGTGSGSGASPAAQAGAGSGAGAALMLALKPAPVLRPNQVPGPQDPVPGLLPSLRGFPVRTGCGSGPAPSR
jgi:hypothetical protein